jgi:hypothetical protein
VRSRCRGLFKPNDGDGLRRCRVVSMLQVMGMIAARLMLSSCVTSSSG